MTIQSAVESELPFLRAEAEAMMLDTFTAYTYTWTKDADGLDVQDWVAQGTTPGKVPNKRAAGDASNARTATVGGVERVVIETGLHLPWSESPKVGMEYELTALGPTTHPSMLGKRYHVVETHPASAMTAWRLDVVDVTPAHAN